MAIAPWDVRFMLRAIGWPVASFNSSKYSAASWQDVHGCHDYNNLCRKQHQTVGGDVFGSIEETAGFKNDFRNILQMKKHIVLFLAGSSYMASQDCDYIRT